MEAKYYTSKLIEELKVILRNHGDLTVFIQGQDSGGIYPNDYVEHNLGIRYSQEEQTITIGLDAQEPFAPPSTVSEFIEMLEESRMDNGDCTVLIKYMDSGGSYGEEWGLSSVDVEEIDGEPHVVIC